jgi:hypothetical protein
VVNFARNSPLLTWEIMMTQNYFVVDFKTKEIFEYLTEEKAMKLCENNPHRIFECYYKG